MKERNTKKISTSNFVINKNNERAKRSWKQIICGTTMPLFKHEWVLHIFCWFYLTHGKNFHYLYPHLYHLCKMWNRWRLVRDTLVWFDFFVMLVCWIRICCGKSSMLQIIIFKQIFWCRVQNHKQVKLDNRFD